MGTLTAGHFDDGNDPARFAGWVEKISVLGGSNGYVYGFEQPAIQLNLINQYGDPIHHARISVLDGRQSRTEARTGTDGRAVLLPDYDAIMLGAIDVSIVVPGQPRTHRHRINAQPGESIDLVIHDAEARLPKKLDLALVIDTTGSMRDELAYLKVEFRSIVERIAQRYPHIDQRWALVVYRDRGDAYRVREYGFTSSLRRFIGRLGDQHAAGGGDYPEAVSQAFEATGDMNWREDAAKIAFLIADAPPHPESAEAALRAASQMRSKGIAVYPVASSGVQAEAELIFRATALMTGGAYSFLTDDSGIGNPHAQPHEAPGHAIQRLDTLMIQLIESELIGGARVVRPREIIREVPANNAANMRPGEDQVRAWRQRRAQLAELLRTTELSQSTGEAVREEIRGLDQHLQDRAR